jgi:hypothetical protein
MIGDFHSIRFSALTAAPDCFVASLAMIEKMDSRLRGNDKRGAEIPFFNQKSSRSPFILKVEGRDAGATDGTEETLKC